MSKPLKLIFKRIFIAVALLVTVFALFMLGFIILVDRGWFGNLPGIQELSDIRKEQASLVYSSDHVLIGKYFAENRTNIKWDEIPDHLKKALIATEDKRFFIHKGFDTQSYLRVLFKSVLSGNASHGGGSTLTQQLVKNLFPRTDFGMLSLPVNKIREIIIASRMEALYSKEDLLLLYLNSVPFGEDVYGVESAANRYFNKRAHELNIQESAVLVGMLKANTYYNPRKNPINSLSRRNTVLTLMKKEHYLSSRTADSLCKLPIELDYTNESQDSPAGYFVYQVKKRCQSILESIETQTKTHYEIERDGLKIYTTLNMSIQDLALDAVRKQLPLMQKMLDKELENSSTKKQWYAKQSHVSDDREAGLKRNIELFDWNGAVTRRISRLDSIWYYYKMLNAAMLILDPQNGAVLGWIGGNNFNRLPFDMVLSHRQIASAFKPILYATAIENGFEPCLYLNNEQNRYAEYKDWEPHNYNLESTPDSTVAMWYALAHSMNLPTVDLFFKLGSENLEKTCNKLGLPPIQKNDPSVALGTLDLSLLEISRVYACLANNGLFNELVLINRIEDAGGKTIYQSPSSQPTLVFKPETSQEITAILQQVINQGTGSSIHNKYGIRTNLAGKTGTAQNYSDAWFLAYTPRLVIGTWVGARSPEIHFSGVNGSGAVLALPITALLLGSMQENSALSNSYLTKFDIPAEVYDFLDCEPFKQIGIRGFFNRLFQPDRKNKSKMPETGKKGVEKQEKKSLFQRLFHRDQ